LVRSAKDRGKDRKWGEDKEMVWANRKQSQQGTREEGWVCIEKEGKVALYAARMESSGSVAVYPVGVEFKEGT
jgi:hypothetical protein